MIEYQISCHLPCSKDTFRNEVEAFLKLMKSIDPHLSLSIVEWLTSLDWNDEEGYRNNFSIEVKNAAGKAIQLLPSIYLYKVKNGHWVQFVLGMSDTGSYHIIDLEDTDGPYEEWVGNFIWSIMKQFHEVFGSSGIYFNDDGCVSMPADALIDATGDFWAFDAAIIPEQLMIYYRQVLVGYSVIQMDYITGFAKNIHWKKLPWS